MDRCSFPTWPGEFGRTGPEYGALKFQARYQIDSRRKLEEQFKRGAAGANAIGIDILDQAGGREDLLNQVIHLIMVCRCAGTQSPGECVFDIKLVCIGGFGPERSVADLGSAIVVEHVISAGTSKTASVHQLEIGLGSGLVNYRHARRGGVSLEPGPVESQPEIHLPMPAQFPFLLRQDTGLSIPPVDP